MSGDYREVVKVRLRAHAYTSQTMPPAEARQERDRLLAEIVAVGEQGWGFVEFTDRYGRQVSLRARDVVVLEVGRPDESTDRHRGVARGRTDPAWQGTAGIGATSGIPDDASGLGFLRRQAHTEAELQASIERHPAGSRR